MSQGASPIKVSLNYSLCLIPAAGNASNQEKGINVLYKSGDFDPYRYSLEKLKNLEY